MRSLIIVVMMLLSMMNYSQEVLFYSDTVGARTVSDNIYNKPAFSDSSASSFCIVIKQAVKAHYHQKHTEHVLVLEGEGMMRLGDKNFKIKKGDLVFIPRNTVHSVKSTGAVPLKVYSIQSPFFDGKDRIMIEEK
jgi:mannose-6-phosphate isomerase-like protein (cupin superfamily)